MSEENTHFECKFLVHALSDLSIFTNEEFTPGIYIKFGICNEESATLSYVQPHMGYQRVGLDLRITLVWTLFGNSGPDQRGRRRQVPGGPELGHPQEWIFWESY